MNRPRPRALLIGGGALALLLAAAPFIPRGGGEDPALLPSGDGRVEHLRPALTAGDSAITPAAQAEIDRVVAAGRIAGRVGTKAGATQLAEAAVRCADFEGQRYCLGVGWTEHTEAEVRSRVARAARTAARGTVETTGDLDAAGVLQRFARLSPAARAEADRAELEDAARSVAKVWLLRHHIQGVPLPAGFLETHPEAVATADAPLPTAARTGRPKPTKSPTPTATASPKPSKAPSPTASATATTDATATAKKKRRDYPRKSMILDPTQVAEQTRTYWCGPASMQMIGWGWKGEPRSQDVWAKRLGTTTSGSAITELVRVTNRFTGWDKPEYAGRYITLDISDWSYRQWYLLMMRHIHDYRAPVILHPVLLKRYFPYLDDDASGHFQVGRGYNKNGKKPDALGFFEPWNQQRFDPSEPFISRVQWRSAYKSYRANQAHFQHNVGV